MPLCSPTMYDSARTGESVQLGRFNEVLLLLYEETFRKSRPAHNIVRRNILLPVVSSPTRHPVDVGSSKTVAWVVATNAVISFDVICTPSKNCMTLFANIKNAIDCRR